MNQTNQDLNEMIEHDKAEAEAGKGCCSNYTVTIKSAFVVSSSIDLLIRCWSFYSSHVIRGHEIQALYLPCTWVLIGIAAIG